MRQHLLEGKKFLVTAGATREPIDDRRFMGNYSGGKLGFDLAAALLEKGATVFLITGPVKVAFEHPQLTVEKVNTACEMYMACCKYFETADAAIFAASVCEYKAKEPCNQALSNDSFLTLKLIKNIDIAAAFAQVKSKNQITVGVLSDPDDNMEKALLDMKQKNLDLIILASGQSPAGNGTMVNNVSIVRNDCSVQPLSPLQSKQEKIEDIIEAILFAEVEKKEAIVIPISPRPERYAKVH